MHYAMVGYFPAHYTIGKHGGRSLEIFAPYVNNTRARHDKEFKLPFSI